MTLSLKQFNSGEYFQGDETGKLMPVEAVAEELGFTPSPTLYNFRVALSSAQLVGSAEAENTLWNEFVKERKTLAAAEGTASAAIGAIVFEGATHWERGKTELARADLQYALGQIARHGIEVEQPVRDTLVEAVRLLSPGPVAIDTRDIRLAA